MINFDNGVCVVVPVEKIVNKDLLAEIFSIYFIFTRDLAEKMSQFFTPLNITDLFAVFSTCHLNFF